jgi:capsular exopolysaccharide synthesis family protein
MTTTTLTPRPPQPVHTDDSVGSVWDLRNLLQIITDRLWILIVCVVLMSGAGAFYLTTATRTYESHALLTVDQRAQKVLPVADVNQVDLEALDTMKTVEQSLTNDEIMLSVAKALDIVHNPEFLKQAATPAGDDEVIKALAKHLKVKVRRGTRLIDISATSRDPQLAYKLVQTIIDQYKQQDLKDRLQITKSANEFLLQQADDLKDKLESAERDLEAYREQNSAVSLEDKQNIVVDTLKDLNLKLGDAKAAEFKLESDLARYRQYANDPKQLLFIPSIADDPSVIAAQRSVTDQQSQLAGIAQVYRPDHPKYQVAQSQLTELQSELDKTILNCGAGLGSAAEAAQANVQKLEQALHQQEEQAMALGKISIPYNVLARNVEVDRSLYEAMITRLKETSLASELDNTPVRILAPARVASEPSSPRPKIIMVISVFAGLVGGVSLCTLLGSIDPSVRSLDEAEEALGLPVLATVPLSRSKMRQGNLPTVNQPNSAAAEAFRSLRTVLELKEATEQQVLLFTSANPGDGKTFCSVNTAVALAQQGHRTLIVDTDLRHPCVAPALGLPLKQAGIVDWFAGKAALEKLIVPTKVPHLFILPAGYAGQNHGALPSSLHLARLLEDPIFRSFDRIVLDTAPVNGVSDALHLVKNIATALCLVVRAGRTPVKAAHRALDLLNAARARDVGVVLNRMAASRYHEYGSGPSRKAFWKN